VGGNLVVDHAKVAVFIPSKYHVTRCVLYSLFWWFNKVKILSTCSSFSASNFF
jgi:hypothetical protein